MTARTALLLGLLVGAAPARANGRFPATSAVFFQPGDDSKIFVGATFGLLVSTDSGQSWRWICENAIGAVSNMDFPYASTGAGTLLAGTPIGLAISRDGGCSWAFGGAGLDPQAWISDIAVASDSAIWVVTASGATANNVFVSRDDARTFAPMPIDEPLAFWKTVRVAPSDPMRVYATGYRVDNTADAASGSEPIVYRSDDGGMKWRRLDFSYPGRPQLALMAVSPTNPDLVFARPLGVESALLRSEDGAGTWTPVLMPTAQLQTVVVYADGQHVLTGSSLNTSGAVLISGDTGRTFAPAAQMPFLACAAQRSDGTLFGCGENWKDMFALGRSADGQGWTPVFRFQQIAGPLDCPAGTAEHDVCAPMWPTLADTFGITGGGAPDAGTAPPKKTGCGCSVAPLAVLVPLRLRLRRRKEPPCAPS
jgi:photosystem II stability/assembly factor-like uncharacterized protein